MLQVLPDYSSGNNEKDIHVHNFSIEIGGQVLIEGADLKLSFAYDIEGFPRHHRVLHVRQEIKPSERSVLDVVVESDVERARLLAESKQIADRAAARDTPGGNTAVSDAEQIEATVQDAIRTQQIFDRLTQIDAYTAEARAATILHGLGFTEAQIHGTTSSLSGG
jgi:ATP-binding cassette subfamily F protein 3